MKREPAQSNSVTTDRIAEGQAALLDGEKARAKVLLEAAVRDAPDNAEAWLWLSGAYTDPKEMARCLRQALLIESDNESAKEGLAWIEATFGPATTAPTVPELPSADATTPPVQIPAPLREQTPAPVRSSSINVPVVPSSEPAAEHVRARTIAPAVPERNHALLESGLHAASFGTLLGLLRLVGSLRPGTLLLIRGPDGLVGIPAAVGLALATALLHATALLAAWMLLGYAVARVRTDRPDDRWDSLVQAGRIFIPGYLVGAALALAAASLSWSQQRWGTVVILVWSVLLMTSALIGRRLLTLLGRPRVTLRLPLLKRLRIALPALLTAGAGLAIAGFVTQALLRGI